MEHLREPDPARDRVVCIQLWGEYSGPQNFQKGSYISCGFPYRGMCLQLSLSGKQSLSGPPCKNSSRIGAWRRSCYIPMSWESLRMARIWAGMSKCLRPPSAPGYITKNVLTFSFLALWSENFSSYQDSFSPYFWASCLGPHSSVNTLI